ncbi:OLC1v1022432C1 [Oldenlandia corymbosa var. corymbosa]|uniref:OLC1v1022432C1 n=1 Tax=Oldenlandia corymbosa var. corymbosa TaxID=529605 RepID=A0AAV1BYI3_OLDCO|nr:OLC1v1022432C1 [Oldenlandia corymbosa var. corymbosa]
MDDSHEILLNSLRNSGVPVPPSVAAIQDLTPASLFYVCSQSLCIIDSTLSFPASLPEDSVADRFKLCTDLASAFKRLGFVGDISFHKFLYPSEEDLYKFVRFLVGRLAVSGPESSQSSQARTSIDGDQTREVLPEFKFVRQQQTEAAASAKADSTNASSGEFSKDRRDVEDKTKTDTGSLNGEGRKTGRVGPGSLDIVEVVGSMVGGKDETLALVIDLKCPKHVNESNSFQGISHGVNSADMKKLLMNLIAKTSKSSDLLDELKAALEFDDRNSLDFYIQTLEDSMETRRERLEKLDSHECYALRLPLEEKRRNLEEALGAMDPAALEKLQQKKDILKEMESVSAEIRRREGDFLLYSAELENQPKVASRESFVLRIKEITKNSRKQDADVERILRDTRELQLETNLIQERLNRTYAVVDETIFREARKDPVARQAYRLLTEIHECFDKTAEKVLSIDRTRREFADYEAKLATMSSRSLDIDKLQADLDALRKENDILERKLGNDSVAIL